MSGVWKSMRLGDFIRLEYGKPLPPKDRTKTGQVPVYGANGIKDWSKKALRSEPTIIVGRKGSAGEIQLTSGPFWPLDVTYFVDFDRSQHDLQFLFYLLSWIGLPRLAKGVKPGINRNEVYALPVTVPDIDEQRRIVAVLDEAFAAIATATANTEKNLANARGLFESYGELLFSNLMSSRVEHVEIGKLTASGSSITYGVVKPGVEGTVAFVRGGDLVDGAVRMDRLRTISQEFSRQYSRTLLQGGELLICLVGTPGECAIAPKELAGANIARQVGMIRLRDDLSAEYVRDYLLSNVGQNALGLKTGGSVQQVINLGDLRLIEIPLPDFRAQSDIVEKLRLMKLSALQLEQCYRHKLAELAALKQSLLQRAFSGGLTATETVAA